MNVTSFYHALLAAGFQIVAALALTLLGVGLTAACVEGGLFAVGFYFGREVAQSENKVGRNPWWIGFDMRLWSVDALCDFLFPVAACAVVVLVSILI